MINWSIAPNNIIVECDATDDIKSGIYGKTSYIGHIYNLSSKKYRPKSDMLITIYKKMLMNEPISLKAVLHRLKH